MTLFEFIENFDKETDIVVYWSGDIEYRGKVCEINLEYSKNQVVIPESVVLLDEEMCIPVKRMFLPENV